jgi:hypothetical protein
MQRITRTLIAVALTLSLGAARTARADAFGDAHDDAPAAHVERAPSRVPCALAPDAHDDSGLSARSFQLPSDAAPTSADAITPDAYDDPGLSASELEPHVQSGP